MKLHLSNSSNLNSKAKPCNKNIENLAFLKSYKMSFNFSSSMSSGRDRVSREL